MSLYNTKNSLVNRAFSLGILVLLFSSCQVLLVEGGRYQPQGGVFDFKDLNPSSAVVRLDGVWEWLPNSLSAPTAIWDDASSQKVKVPARWSSYQVDGKPFESFGVATYRIRILPPRALGPWGIKINSLGSAFEFYANGKLLAKAGSLSTQPEGGVAAYAPQVVTLPDSDTGWEIRLLVSNWEHRDGGLFYSLFFGQLNQVLALRQNLLFMDIFVFASLLIMGIYNLGLYFFLRRDKSPLWFALTCFLFAIRTVVYGEYFILSFWPELNWQILQKLGYLTLYAAPALFFLFFDELIHKQGYRSIPRWLVQAVNGVAAVSGLVTLVFPMFWFSQLQIPYQIWIVLLFAPLLYFLIQAIRTGFLEGYWFLAGLGVLVLTVVNDVLHTSHVINTANISSLGFLTFLVSQSFLVTQNFSKAFFKVDRLSQSLELTNQALQRFVPTEFLSYLGKKSITDIELGEHVEHTMSIMFSDIRSFTRLSEKMKPVENFNFINSYLKRITPPIRSNGGFIDKYLGDGIMALFPEQADHALAAGLEMLDSLNVYNQHRMSSGYDPIDIGIGIHTGSLMMGTIGNEFRMDSTVISDAVNLASRLESLNREFGTHLLISLETLQALQNTDHLAYRFLGVRSIKGKTDPVPVFEVFENDPEEMKQQKIAIQDRFEVAVNLVLEGRSKDAKKLFKKLHKEAPLDSVVRHYWEQL